MAAAEHVSYEKPALSEAQIRAGVDALFDVLPSDAELRAKIQKENGDPDLLYAHRDEAIGVSRKGASFGAETLILIALSQHVGTRLWDRVLEPWLLERLGRDALGTRRKKS